jgi:hypothetical protein
MTRSRAFWVLLIVSSIVLATSVFTVARTGSTSDSQIVPDLGFRVPVTVVPSPGTAVTAAPTFIEPLDEPMRIAIKAISITAPVVATGLDSTNAVKIPADITTVGWYRLGVAPGSPVGSAVIVGHRDGREQGHGAFYNLSQLGIADRITVTTTRGAKLVYRVTARETIKKSKLPLDNLFAITGSPRLTLISCAGYYSKDNGGYQDNIVITAVPAGTATAVPSTS